MQWRLRKLDWRYALGELIIVTAGVLIALAIDQWNSDRLDRADEILIIEGLVSDLEFDRARIEQGLGFVPEKEASLRRVYQVLVGENANEYDPSGFLGDVIEGSRYGWVQFFARRNTFDELLSAGRFSLISDSELRSRIAEYYARTEELRDRIDERETIYPNMSYQAVFRADEFSLDPSLTEEELERLASRAMQVLPIGAVVAEINFSRFVEVTLTEADEWRQDLMERLEAYRSTIQ
jgi:hypothetical protein